MAHSREVRLPFLDRRIAEFAYSLPPAWVYGAASRSGSCATPAAPSCPNPSCDATDKVGYEPPQQRWLSSGAFRERIRAVLLDDASRANDLYDAEAIERDAGAGSWRDPAGIWRALNAELWLRALAPTPA